MTNTSDDTANEAPDGDVDALGRRAGAMLRRPAPAGGASRAMATGRAVRRRQIAVVGVGTALLAVIAVVVLTRGSDDNSVTIATTPAKVATTAAPEASTSAAPLSATDAWIQSFTGNPAGTTDGPSYRIGVAHGNGATLDDATLEAVADYLNSNVGGIGGRPIELVLCEKPSGDVKRCAPDFSDDAELDIVLVQSQIAADTPAFIDRLGTDKIVIGTGDDRALAFVPTFEDELIGAAHLAEELVVGDGVVVLLACPCGETTDPTAVVQGALGSIDLVTGVDQSDSQIEAAIAPVPPGSVVINFDFGTCSTSIATIRRVRPDLPIVAPPVCGSTDGIYIVGAASSDHFESDADQGARAIEAMLTEAGWEPASFRSGPIERSAGLMWPSELLTVVRVINELGGPDAIDGTSFASAMRSYSGPLPMGMADCGTRGGSGSCVTEMPVSRVQGDELIPQPPVSARP